MSDPETSKSEDAAENGAHSLADLEAKVETHIDQLLQAVANLRRENSNLRNQRASLLAERATLVEKSEQARSRVEAMIARLKTMELGV